ncbi:hypothetical protein C8Q75DRAFT_249427 [Abortiporus biennis]|nr:hypothetical protein C8Q75DRAFT_249427 [Abortiporus biennis]
MSGQIATEQSQDAQQRPPGLEMATVEDSLRAAALMTLKSKRRKANVPAEVPPGLPARPPPPESIQLDYGDEEPSPGSATMSTSVEQPLDPMDVDEPQVREEGEISDSESTPSGPPNGPQNSKLPEIIPKVQAPDLGKIPSTQSKHPTISSSPRIKSESVPQIIPPKSLSVDDSASAAVHTSVSDSSLSLLGNGFVRPGLAMTQKQYDTAKDIVLDLLGWGVPPEYLASCGLSHELIYFIFSELNLRLPSNIDFSGIAVDPYAHCESPEPITPVPHTGSTHSPMTSVPRPLQGHPSLPQKPSVPQGSVNEASVLSPSAVPFIPGTSASEGISSAALLLDMEQQRRQELLARKAVQASRKTKLALTTSPNSGPSGQPPTIQNELGSASSDIPKETVEDFLKSIGSVSDTPTTNNTPTPTHSTSPDAMDVDEPPGLRGTDGELSLLDTDTRLSVSLTRSISVSDVSSPSANTVLPSAAISSSSRPSSVDSSSHTSNPHTDVDPAVQGSGSSTPRQNDSSGLPRRVTKRPVASDFVDMEPGSTRGYGRHNHPYQPHPRKKTNSFAGIVGHRRMVIHLSDSEDEDEDTHPTSTARTSVTPSATPSALLEKEQEIRRMRELIAQREQNRLKKLAAASGRSTPNNFNVSSSATIPAIAVKQEEDDASQSAPLSDSKTVEETSRTSEMQTSMPQHNLPLGCAFCFTVEFLKLT